MMKATEVYGVQLHPTKRQSDTENVASSLLFCISKRMDHPLKNSLLPRKKMV